MRIASAALVAVLAWIAPRVARADPPSTHNAVTSALVDGDYARALTLATHAAAQWPRAAWPDYARGVALGHLGRTDAAVRAFERVQDNPSAGALKAVAVFGSARALDNAGRCEQAHIAYDEYAALVQAKNPAAARVATTDASECYAHAHPDPLPSSAASALIAGDYGAVLEMTNVPTTDRQSRPWLEYDRASALTELGRTDAAVRTFKQAAAAFGGQQRWGRSLAVWGEARALDNAGRCREAERAYHDYAKLTRPVDPASAKMAERYARACTTR